MSEAQTVKSFLRRALLAGVAILGVALGVFAARQLFNSGEYAKYIPTHQGNIRQISPTESGVSRDAAVFLSQFRRPIALTMGAFSLSDKELVRTELLKDYIKDSNLLDGWANFSSDRERFINYLMLRVNGSLPNYVTKPPPDLPELLTSPDGNCADQSFRLLMLLDLFGIFGRDINWLTSSIEGHHFVDAYDPIENRSYFLDPTNNLAASAEAPWKGAGFVDLLTTKSSLERKQILNGTIIQYPAIFDSSDIKEGTFYQWSESTMLRSRDSMITGLSKELPEMIESWRSGKGKRPLYTLCQFAEEGALSMDTFQPMHCLSSDFLLNQSISRE